MIEYRIKLKSDWFPFFRTLEWKKWGCEFTFSEPIQFQIGFLFHELNQTHLLKTLQVHLSTSISV